MDRPRSRLVHSQVGGLETKTKAKNGPLFKRSLQCTLLFSPLVLSFNCSELVENDEAHPDLTEELDWYVRIANDYQKKVQYYHSERVI